MGILKRNRTTVIYWGISLGLIAGTWTFVPTVGKLLNVTGAS